MNQKTETFEDLKKQVAELQVSLAAEKEARTQAELVMMEMAEASSASSGIVQVASDEIPTGKTIKMSICSNPYERDERKQKFKQVDVPTFFYNIQLPTGAGTHLMTNGEQFFHGETYEFDEFTLREIKSRVARCWDHEKSIHGNNENAYRKPTNVLFQAKRSAN